MFSWLVSFNSASATGSAEASSDTLLVSASVASLEVDSTTDVAAGTSSTLLVSGATSETRAVASVFSIAGSVPSTLIISAASAASTVGACPAKNAEIATLAKPRVVLRNVYLYCLCMSFSLLFMSWYLKITIIDDLISSDKYHKATSFI